MIYADSDAFCCGWLQRLIETGHLPRGEVRHEDIRQARVADPTTHWFAGVGGWPLALRLAGWPDDLPVWTASLPCQPFSNAGAKRAEADDRHLWPVFRPLVDQYRPPVIFGEQVASPPGRSWLAAVRVSLEALGYAVGAADLCAASVGAPHNRPRLYWVAVSNRHGRAVLEEARLHGVGQPRPDDSGCGAAGAKTMGNADGYGAWEHSGELPAHEGQHAFGGPIGRDTPEYSGTHGSWSVVEWRACADGFARPLEPGLEPVVDGVPSIVEWKGLVRCYGNAIVPQVAAEFIRAAVG